MHQVTVKIGKDELVLETGNVAKQANGSILAKYGESVVLATVCVSNRPSENLDFVPLSVEYNEKYYAAGKIPGGFLKREGRPKEKEILVCRLIDRPMRPLFDKKFGREIQVIPTTISTDQINPPDIIGMNAAFAAVYISDIPFNGPVAAVRVAKIGNEYLINPTFDQIEKSELEIIVAGSDDGITMVEGGGKEASEDDLISAIETAESHIKAICQAQRDLRALAGKEKLPMPVFEEPVLENKEEMEKLARELYGKAWFVAGKFEREHAVKEAKAAVAEKFAEYINEENRKTFDSFMNKIEKDVVRRSILDQNRRCDERKNNEIRDISCSVDFLKRTHGSALFTRGETQALAVTTLGTVFDEQIMDDIDGDRRARFMLHYNFPPFSVGETGRLFTGRREIGHGHLAQRSLENVLPGKDKFPYTIRVVSEILESNGSSSMATVCGGSLSLLNAGVPLLRPVAGIAMGLISDGEKNVVLSDILGEEDHLGDMDFKVAGTEKGITGFQMDIKISNVTRELMEKALQQAKEGRLHILGIMNSTLANPAGDVSDYAPKISKLMIDPDKIGLIIGPGGKNIKAIAEESGANINIENDGTVTIYCRQKEGAELAESRIRGMIEEPEMGRVYQGTVKRLMDFGAFIEFLPGKEGLCHISKISKDRIESVSDVLRDGQSVKVRIIDIDKMNRISLSIVDALDDNWTPGRGTGRRQEH